MEKKSYSIRVKSDNMTKVKDLAKNERRKIGDQLDIIIEYYFRKAIKTE